MIGSIVSGVGGAVGGLVGGIANAVNGSKQLKLQKEQFEYQKQLNQQQMQREDTAVQRRMADLEKAGLSKNLATGAGLSAQTSPLSSGNALPSGNDLMINGTQMIGDSIGKGLDAASSVGNLINMYKQGKKIDADRGNVEADTELKRAQAITELKKQGVFTAQEAKTLAEKTVLQHNLSRSKAFKLRTTDQLGKDSVYGLNVLDAIDPKRLLKSGVGKSLDIAEKVLGLKFFGNLIFNNKKSKPIGFN